MLLLYCIVVNLPMKTLAGIFLLAICSSCATAQKQVDDGTFQVLDSLEVFRDISVQKNIISHNHLVVIDGITMASQEHLNACLKDICARDNASFGLMDIRKARTLMNGKKAKNGIVLVNLGKRAHRQFSKNHRRFKKKLTDNSP